MIWCGRASRPSFNDRQDENVSKPEIRLGNDAGLVRAVLEPPGMRAQRGGCLKNLEAAEIVARTSPHSGPLPKGEETITRPPRAPSPSGRGLGCGQQNTCQPQSWHDLDLTLSLETASPLRPYAKNLSGGHFETASDACPTDLGRGSRYSAD